VTAAPLALRWRAWREVRQTEREIRAEDRAQRKAGRQARPAGPAPASLRVPRALALAGISVLVGAASLTSFAESYRGLYDWSHEHGLSGLWSAVWPLQVDVFIAVGELALFVALADSWRTRSRAGAWLVTLGGLAVSVAGNVGHVHSSVLTNRATAAVPPLAAAAALAVGLGVLKRVVGAHRSAPHPAVPMHLTNGHGGPEGGPEAAERFAAELAAGDVPSIRRIRAELHCGQPRASEVQAYLEALTPAGQNIRRIRDEIRQTALPPPDGESEAERSRPG
jgi:hypothetical protein